jgi:hypothetical protein
VRCGGADAVWALRVLSSVRGAQAGWRFGGGVGEGGGEGRNTDDVRIQ